MRNKRLVIEVNVPVDDAVSAESVAQDIVSMYNNELWGTQPHAEYVSARYE